MAEIMKGYQIKELKNTWKVSKVDGKLSVSYEISKELCNTVDDVKAYISEKMKEGEQNG